MKTEVDAKLRLAVLRPLRDLTPRQRALLAIMHVYRREWGRWPSAKEIPSMASSVVHYNRRVLEYKGLALGQDRGGRTWRPNYRRVAFVTVDGHCTPWEIVKEAK